MNKKQKNILVLILLLVFIIGLIIFFKEYSPEQIVENLGVNNSFILTFLLAAFAGISSLTVIALIATTTTLIGGGIDPLIVSLIAGIGLVISDAFIYYIGFKGREVLENYEKTKNKFHIYINKFSSWLSQKSVIVINFVIIIYFGLTPLPNELLMVILGISKTSFKTIIPGMIIGNMLFVLLLSLGLFQTLSFLF